MLSFIQLDKPHIDIELYGTDTNIAPIDKVHIMRIVILFAFIQDSSPQEISKGYSQMLYMLMPRLRMSI